jgi:FtsZ-binding cell division protein ZapB
MSEVLLDRLQVALEDIRKQKHQLMRECYALRQEKSAWQEEKAALLVDVERALKRFESLDLEGL